MERYFMRQKICKMYRKTHAVFKTVNKNLKILGQRCTWMYLCAEEFEKKRKKNPNIKGTQITAGARLHVNHCFSGFLAAAV